MSASFIMLLPINSLEKLSEILSSSYLKIKISVDHDYASKITIDCGKEGSIFSFIINREEEKDYFEDLAITSIPSSSRLFYFDITGISCGRNLLISMGNQPYNILFNDAYINIHTYGCQQMLEQYPSDSARNDSLKDIK